MINPNDLIALFRQAYNEKWGYIWGTAGVKWTAEKQAAVTNAMAQKYGSKWIGHIVADCSGLFAWAFKKLGGYMYHGSNTMFKKYTTANGMLKSGARSDGQTMKPGTAVFKLQNGNDYYHVGLYVGDGTVIEAQGTSTGVVTSKVSSWHCWGELKGVDYGSTEASTVKTEETKKETVTTTQSEDSEEYTVQRGDTLWRIAQKFYGSGRKYTLISEANSLKNTNIHMGMKLKIPKA